MSNKSDKSICFIHLYIATDSKLNGASLNLRSKPIVVSACKHFRENGSIESLVSLTHLGDAANILKV